MYQNIIVSIKNLSYLEILAFVSGIAYVWLAVRENAFCWWAGIINIISIGILSYWGRLYADVGLQLVYLWLTIRGLYWWQKKAEGGGGSGVLSVSKMNFYEWKMLILVGGIFFGMFTFFLKNYSDTDVAVWDSGVVALSLVATWQTARKKIENWLVWIVADILYVGLYYYKALYLLLLLSVVYCVLAVVGFYAWRKKLSK